MLSLLLLLAQPQEQPVFSNRTRVLPECNQERADRGDFNAKNTCAYLELISVEREMREQLRLAQSYTLNSDRERDEGFSGASPMNDALNRSQESWVIYRNEHCEMRGFLVNQGAFRNYLNNSCKVGLTKERIEELKLLIEAF